MTVSDPSIVEKEPGGLGMESTSHTPIDPACLPMKAPLPGVEPAPHVEELGLCELRTISPLRRGAVMACLCISMLVEGSFIGSSTMLTPWIARDVGILPRDYVWVLASYMLGGASTVLIAGRLTDLYPPHRIFCIGFTGVGIVNLVISFMPEQYSFFVLRGLNGMFAALTIPSSVNMIVQMWPQKKIQSQRLSLFHLAGSIAGSVSFIFAGLLLMASWRWYFRFVAILVLPMTVVAWFIFPDTYAVAMHLPSVAKWRRMDLLGVFLNFSMICLLIFAFVSAAALGWGSPKFIAPLCVSVALAVCWLVWIRRLPLGYALIQHEVWHYPNILPLTLHGTGCAMWFSSFKAVIYFQETLKNTPILAAAKFVPLGVLGLLVGLSVEYLPFLVTRPRFVQPCAGLLVFAAMMLLSFSKGGAGADYWRFIFTSEVFTAFGGTILLVGTQTAIVQAFPPEYAGVAGGYASMVSQTGGVISMALQTAIGTTGRTPWEIIGNGYWFAGAYMLVTGFIFALWYRQSKPFVPHSEKKARNEKERSEQVEQGGGQQA